MRKILTILFLLISVQVTAPVYPVFYIDREEPINFYDPLMKAITSVESSNGVDVYNSAEDAKGWFQIRPIRLNDYNKRTGSSYTHDDCYDYEISKKIFMHYTEGRSYEKVTRSWNGSGAQTLIYWNKVKLRL